MLWLITGGIGSGKSAFADELAYVVGREGIRLSCPPFPEMLIEAAIKGTDMDTEMGSDIRPDFPWTRSDADETLAKKLNAINLDSNFYRADRRVVVIDSLSGWLRGVYRRIEAQLPEAEERIEAEWREALEAILAFQGRVIVVTEELSAGLSMNVREQGYAYRLANANRKLMESSEIVYRMTAGMATELKGYRLKRGSKTDENLYPDR
ncbi:bifunctional adenosylcobinamide kinase/adenosylcobinamide-phosphate guanylyltransferase [Cohnella herbarum]|uniref:Adenosylcobinamide kinase n=1 Tax=Cohnella herbarum TaxID=2728023 RepID=A0A7Z2VR17_9BACL|nr:bifunctional adenosylcobinamide kinase/adenosylcobinamide-phosphate guanylyltransferase [Cohnella herbarum]QJD87565.1 hypothetical protein HH215_33210 [Cohnella herbarum]